MHELAPALTLLPPAWRQHLPLLPVLQPLLTAIVLLMVSGQRRLRLQRALGLASLVLGGIVVVALLQVADTGSVMVYRLGNWPPPFGIVLAVDRLGAYMLAMAWLIAVPILWYACHGWDERGLHFHALFQLQLMGLNGAFLTGDLFNLFVFFEILLIASYVLLLHGRGDERLRNGLHYVILNLVASSFFLIGLALVYGITGTLNMADVALRAMQLAQESATQAWLLRITALLLLTVFGLKAAVFPLHVWLPGTYASASAPVAALFAIMTKVGIYAILRTHVMMWGQVPGAGDVAQHWLLPLGILTAVTGVLGALAAHRLARLVAWLTVTSVGTVLTGAGLGTVEGLSAGLYYALHSTLVMAAMFLLVELVALQRGSAYDRLQPANRLAQPATLGLLVLLGSASAAGLPPLPGFLGKLMLLHAAAGHMYQGLIWASVLGVGFLTLIGLARAGSLLFWSVEPAAPASGHLPASTPYIPSAASWAVLAPSSLLLGCVMLVAVYAAPLKHYTDAMARQLLDIHSYATQVLGPQQHNGISLSTRPYTGHMPAASKEAHP